MTTLTVMRTSIRLRLGINASDPQLTDADLNEMINASFIQAGNLRNWPWMQTERTFSTVASTQDYAFHATHRKTLMLRIGEGMIRFRTRRDLTRLIDDSGSPSYWTHVRVSGTDYIRFVPTPSSVQTVTEVYLIQHVTLSSDSDAPVWPDWATDYPMLQAAQMAANRVAPDMAAKIAQELGRAYQALMDEIVPAVSGALPARRHDWQA